MAHDGQLTEKCRQDNNKMKYIFVFETRNYFDVIKSINKAVAYFNVLSQNYNTGNT
jgi:hypothetical protein